MGIYNGYVFSSQFSNLFPAVMSSSSFVCNTAHNGWVSVNQTQAIKRGIQMQTIYDVFLVYGENRLSPVIESRRVVACNPEEAKLKSKISALVQEDWDMDFVTIITNPIGSVAVKERPTEVKSV